MKPGTSAPHSNETTSLEAAMRITVRLAHLENVVMHAILQRADGITDEEIELATGLKHQTATARRRGLVIYGLVRDSGRTRALSTGRRGIVWTWTGAAGEKPAR